MKKILIADDDRDIVELLQSRLTANGFNVVTANDCSEAIKKAYSEGPDLIIMDIKMPKVGGISAFENLKMYTRTETIPVIFITAYPNKDVQEKVAEMGAADFIAKPFETEELLLKINYALGKKVI
jgi:two-component system alkaline phosphatase synthesis response regulator PhoP